MLCSCKEALQLGAFGVDDTPQYFRDKSTAERLFDFIPEADVVLLLRDPLSRMRSAYQYFCPWDNLCSESELLDVIRRCICIPITMRIR
jgi:hypothetical protein